jgi:hypothetical protein
MKNVIFDGGSLPTTGTPENTQKYTSFATVYNCFLSKITDDMYLELTPEDTLKDLQNLLLNAIPGFEFPKVRLDKYLIEVVEINTDLVTSNDFVIGHTTENFVLVERSYFGHELTNEEINILAILMMEGWV